MGHNRVDARNSAMVVESHSSKSSVASRPAANGPEIAATPVSWLAWPEWVTRSSVREARRRGPERQCVAIDIGINSAWSDSRGDARGVRRDAVKVGGRP